MPTTMPACWILWRCAPPPPFAWRVEKSARIERIRNSVATEIVAPHVAKRFPPLRRGGRGGGGAHLGDRDCACRSLAIGPSGGEADRRGTPAHPVIGRAETTPPNPPFARGGNSARRKLREVARKGGQSARRKSREVARKGGQSARRKSREVARKGGQSARRKSREVARKGGKSARRKRREVARAPLPSFHQRAVRPPFTTGGAKGGKANRPFAALSGNCRTRASPPNWQRRIGRCDGS